MTARVCLLAFAAGVFGCGRAVPEAKPDVELNIPKLPPDAGAPPSEGKSPLPPSTGQGWVVRPEKQLNPEYVDRAAALDEIKKGPQRALLVHVETLEECSSAGGSHAFFTVVEPGEGTVHFGNHGAMLQHAFDKGQLWVASIVKYPIPLSLKHEAWCVPDRTTSARAIAMVPVASAEEGRRLLEELDR